MQALSSTVGLYKKTTDTLCSFSQKDKNGTYICAFIHTHCSCMKM